MKFEFFAFIQGRLLLQEGIFCFGAENPFYTHQNVIFIFQFIHFETRKFNIKNIVLKKLKLLQGVLLGQVLGVFSWHPLRRAPFHKVNIVLLFNTFPYVFVP